MKNKDFAFFSIIQGIVQLPKVAFSLMQNVQNQKAFIKKNLLPELDAIMANSDGSLQPVHLKKITTYYGLGVPAILGYGFSLLRNEALSGKERACMTYLGGISGLLDDLFDDQEREVLHLEQFIADPHYMVPSNTYETLLKHLYQLGLNNANDPIAVKQKASMVFNSEQQSKLQLNKELSPEKLRELTFLKGGHSFLFYRLCMDTPLESAEENMVYQLGGVMQLGNDIFDVWEDHQQGIQTLATQAKTISELRIFFTKELERAITLTNSCHYPKKQLEGFTKLILLGMSRVYVCLDQFEKLQDSDSAIFQPEKYSRKQLICDMETLKNKKAACRHYLRLHSKYV